MQAIGRDPIFVERGEGAELIDVDGNRYVDWMMSWGPLIAGHAHPDVVAAVTERRRARHELRRADAGGGRPRRGGRRARAVRRDGADDLVRHRGDDERAPAGARRDGPGQDPQVRRRLPRARGRAARRRRLGPRDAGDPVEPRRDRRAGGGHDHRSLERPRRRRSRGRWAWPRSCASPTRRTWAWSPPEPGFLEFLREQASAAGALLVFDEVISGFRVATRRRPGARGGHARPDDPRQGDRRRAAGGGVRGAARADGAHRAGGRRLPGGHAVGEPARDGRRARDAAPARRATPTSGSSGPRARSPRGSIDLGLTVGLGDRAAHRLLPRRDPARTSTR